MPAKKTIAEYLDRARQIHGGKYDYSLVTEVTSNKAEISIICPVHGVFRQVLSGHVNAKQGCPRCGGNFRKTVEEVLIEARKAHGDRYVYPAFEYRTNKQMIEIHCREHGPFIQEVKAHLYGVGCPRCATNPKTDTASFIVKARRKHGDAYDYTKVDYRHNEAHVTITCRKHGDYSQTPHAHLAGYGCSRCVANSSKKENAWLDSLNLSTLLRQHKIAIGRRRFTVDGYDPATNTVYEFNGDYFHGNPRFFDSVWVHRMSKQPFGQMYVKTLEKEAALRRAGFNVVSIWESDWMAAQSDKPYRKEPKPDERHINRLRYIQEWHQAEDEVFDESEFHSLLTEPFRVV
jgi:hypothetical protein